MPRATTASVTPTITPTRMPTVDIDWVEGVDVEKLDNAGAS
jgi:hypothetical protein